MDAPSKIDPTSKNVVKMLSTKVIQLFIEEVNKSDTQSLIKRRVITPVINMIYAELYPYIVALIVTIVVILVLSILTFTCFLMYYLRNI